MSLLIKGGNVFLEGNFIKTDILINGKKISQTGTIPADKVKLSGSNTIDASGKLVMPGLIDIHVHFRDFGQEYKEDWASGSIAAAAGGITTVFEMPNNLLPITTLELFNEKTKAVSKKSITNFGLYMAVTDDNIEEINKSVVRLVKLYYGHTTGNINAGNTEKIFKELRENILIVIHAEDNKIIEENKKKFHESKKNYHSLVRDNKAELEAINRLIFLAGKYNRKIHLTHISTKEAILAIKQAKKKSLKVTCDTCPHYLFLDDSLYEKIGNMAKVNPALKSMEDRSALWVAINDGTIDCICSDHAPHTLSEKQEQEYDKALSGFPGVETALPLMLTALNHGKLKFEKLIELMSENPAKIFDIKNKGSIKKDYDADLIIVDMDKEDIISGQKLFTKSKWSPFEGMKTKGRAVMTIVNGKIVYGAPIS